MSRPPTRTKAFLAVIVTSAAVLVTVPLVQADSSAVEGSVFAGEVVPAPAGCSTDPGFGPAPTIDWADGTPLSAGVCTQNPSGVSTGPHTYSEAGDYSAVAYYSSSNGARSTAFSVHVADAALSATSNGVAATAGVSFSGVIAHFTDADPGGATSDYAATITWGDGSSSPGTVQASGAGFDVSGAHTYANAGSDPLTVAINDTGGATASASGTASIGPPSTTSTTTTSTTPTGTTTATSTSPTPPPSPAGSPPAHAIFTLASSAGSGRTVMIDAGASRQPGVTINTYRWTVNGKQLASCAGATSELMTRTLPAGSDTIALTLIGPSGGSLASTSHTIVVRATAQRALAASLRGRGRVIVLPGVATCLLGPQDPPSGGVAPGVRFAPRAGCDTQVQSGMIDALGCLTEHQDPIVVKFVPGAKTSDGRRRENQVSPAGQSGLDGVNVAADQSQLLADVENAINPAEPPLCRDPRTGATYICSTVGGESLSAGARFGGGPVENIGPVTGFSAAVARIGTPSATEAGLHGPIQLLHPACPAPQATVGPQADQESCLDLWVADGPVRINGIDFAPPAGGELVIAPQFNLVVSQDAPGSLDGLQLNSSSGPQAINADLPSAAASSGIDSPALTVPDLPAELEKQQHTAPTAILDALKSVGGFPALDGLEISFADDTATITFHVKMPDAFDDGNGNPVTAAVQARIGPTEPFHITYGYFGALQGGASVDLGPVALTGFGLCYRERYSPDPNVDPCQGITSIDDSGLGNDVWMGVGSLSIGGLVNVEFRPGSNTIPGCAAGPLGFAFSADGGLSYAGAAVDLSGSGGIPIFPGVAITGFAAGFQTAKTYDTYSGCVSLSVVDLLSVTGNVFGVHTVNGQTYQFKGDELGANVLQQTGGSYPYTDHVGFGASGVVSLTLPELPAFQVGDAYALYVDDPAAIFFGAGLDLGFPHGNFEDQPGTGFAFKGGLKGAIGLGGGFPFDFEGYVAFQANALGFNVIGGDAELIISYNPHNLRNSGLGACFGLSAGRSRASAGIAYHWGDSYFDLPDDLKVGGCDNNWLDSQIGVNVQTASAGRRAPTTVVARVPRGLNGVNLRLHSAVGAPDVTVTAPGGAAISTAGLAPNRIVPGPAFTLARYPASHLTIIAPTRARAGRYRITLNPGSPPITRLDRLDGIRPRINAHVTGSGQHRRLIYSFTRRAGQDVEFLEISGQVHRLLGSTTGGHGSLPFTASAGHGRRRIVAEVFGDGAPNVRMTVSTYQAPSLARLGRVAHLRVRHSRDRALVAFAPVRGASEYRINMKLSDGTRQVINTRAHHATFAPIFVDSGGTITVQAVGDGLHTRSGASVRGGLSPLFGPGMPMRRHGRPVRRRH
jgi:hypothetical protein